MYALDNKSGIEQMPEIPEVFSKNPRWFTEGRDGNAPSYPGAHWFNIVQAELLNVLKEAGIEPEKADLTQLAQAFRVMAGQVESITALREFEPVRDRQMVDVKGYYANSTKGGGYFVTDLTDTASADNGGTVIVTTGGKRWLRVFKEVMPEDFGAVGDKTADDTDAFLRAIAISKVFNLPFIGNKKYKLTQDVNFREVNVDLSQSEILMQGGQVIIGGHAGSSWNPNQKFGKILSGNVEFNSALYTKPTVKCMGAKGQIIDIKYTDYLQLFMSTDPKTFPQDASIAYSTFNLGFVVKLEITTDERFNDAQNIDGAGGANQWCNENIFNLNRCFALEMKGSYRHNCNLFIGGTFESKSAYIDIQSGNKNRFINTRLENVGFVRFGEKTEGNILERSYFGSLSSLFFKVEDEGVFNRVDTASITQSVKNRIIDINPFQPKWNNMSPPYQYRQVSRTIKPTVRYGQVGESDWVEFQGKKDALIFDLDNDDSVYSVRILVRDQSGNSVDCSNLSYSSGSFRANENNFSGTIRGGFPYGQHRFLIMDSATYYIKLEIIASVNTDLCKSRYFTVDLYSDRPRTLSNNTMQTFTNTKPTQYIGFKGDVIVYPTGRVTVDEHFQTSITDINNELLTFAIPTGSTVAIGDCIGIENRNGDVFWSSVETINGNQASVKEALPNWVTVGCDLYISRLSNTLIRRSYSKQITGTADTTKTMGVNGETIVYSNGRIVQTFNVKAIKYIWFNLENNNTYAIPFALWTAMPNKIINVTIKTLKNADSTANYAQEAAEWITEWAMHRQNGLGHITINAVRRIGGANEDVDMYVVVEGI